MTALLETHNLCKAFGGLAALTDVCVRVMEAEILGLIGPNGSGKSTFFNVVSGHIPPSKGEVRFEASDITRASAHKIASLGIGRTFQTSNLFTELSVLENVFAGFHMSYQVPMLKRVLRLPAARREEQALKQRSLDIVDWMGLFALRDELAGNLSHGHQRILGVCMALAIQPRVLLLDEPVAGMNMAESMMMVERIQEIRAKGIAVVIVEHDMRVITRLCDRVVVLNYGHKIAEGLPTEIMNNEEVIAAYLGGEGATRCY